MIKIPHIQDFEWSPTDNYISYWVAQDKNVLARVVLMEMPSKNEIRSKVIILKNKELKSSFSYFNKKYLRIYSMLLIVKCTGSQMVITYVLEWTVIRN